MNSIIRAFGISTLLGLLTSAQAFAGGYVADVLRFKVDDGHAEVQAGRFWFKPLPTFSDAELEVGITVHNKIYNDVDALVCTERELSLYRAGRPARCAGVNRGKGSFTFRAPAHSPERLYLVINNSFSLVVKKKVSFTVFVRDRIDQVKRRALEDGLAKGSAAVSMMFEVPEFDLRVEPCGQDNAYSNSRTGDITICSEMFMGMALGGQKGALSAIMFHEMGHTLLNLWGLPGYDNEETVDEFAVVMLYLQGKQEYAIEWIDWFEKHDSRQQALTKLYVDDRHPLSVQRIRNIRRILQNPGPVIARWNRLLYPRMTVAGLEEVQKLAPMYADRDLAKKLIADKASSRPEKRVQYKEPNAPSSQQPMWAPPPQK